jgi:hypothetical protein
MCSFATIEWCLVEPAFTADEAVIASANLRDWYIANGMLCYCEMRATSGTNLQASATSSPVLPEKKALAPKQTPSTQLNIKSPEDFPPLPVRAAPVPATPARVVNVYKMSERRCESCYSKLDGWCSALFHEGGRMPDVDILVPWQRDLVKWSVAYPNHKFGIEVFDVDSSGCYSNDRHGFQNGVELTWQRCYYDEEQLEHPETWEWEPELDLVASRAEDEASRRESDELATIVASSS